MKVPHLTQQSLDSGLLYDQDFVVWVEKTANSLETGDFSSLDIKNLIEEIQDLGKREKQQLKGKLRILLMHLLKWQYQPERRSFPGSDNLWNQNSWANSIREARNAIQDSLEDSPSLYNYLSDNLDVCYQKARTLAQDETALPLKTFPDTCPFSKDQILDDEFWPNS